jgi:hypothetical protein
MRSNECMGWSPRALLRLSHTKGFEEEDHELGFDLTVLAVFS